jgi:sulfatase modifying factor 1
MTAAEFARTPGPAPAEGMVWIPGGGFRMGSNVDYPEEAPAHRVTVEGFWMDAHQVTNRQFAAFVEQTGYVTVAERPLDPNDFPGAPTENLVPGSARLHDDHWSRRSAPLESLVDLDTGCLLDAA